MERRGIGTPRVSVVAVGCSTLGKRLDEAGTKAEVDADLAAADEIVPATVLRS